MQSAAGRLAVALVCLAPACAISAQSGPIEEVVVTGSYIRGTPEDAASPVSVTDREDLNMRGNPTILELIKSLGPVTGVDGESNQFQSNGLEGSSNINLRGLGPGRTLVLLNGRRMTFSPLPIPETGQLFVNSNTIPSIAIARMELLKDGASATYGSDAVSGVTNFITRSDFRGIDIQGGFKDINESDGDWDIGAMFGWGTDATDIVFSGGYQFRSKLEARDLGFPVEPTIAENPRGGFSSISNPVNLTPLDFSPLFIADPDCTAVGGQLSGGLCNFRFVDFDNAAEEEEHWQLMSELTHQFDSGGELHAEVVYSRDEVNEWNTSPSYPPQALIDPTRTLVPGIPHFDDFLARNPALVGELGAGALVTLGRTAGVSGPPQEGSREYDTWRVSVDYEGSFDFGVDYSVAATYGSSKAELATNDTRIDNLAFAYRGLGGPDCDVNSGVPGSGNVGSGNCFYYNPFTSGYRTSSAAGFEGVASPGFRGDETLLNDPTLLNWLTDVQGFEFTTNLFVVDAVITGDSSIELAGGTIGWAAGFQYRREEYESDPNNSTDLTATACPFGLAPGETFTRGVDGPSPGFSFNCPTVGFTGPFHFLAGSLPFDDDQDIYAAFVELALPVFERGEVQFAVRAEDYGGRVGATLDPKLAIRYDARDDLTLRASIGTSFRAPGLNQLGGRGTSLQFIAPVSAFKAVDTLGNPDLRPEEALTTNIGVVYQRDGLFDKFDVFATLDWWSFRFKDPIVIEPAGDIVAGLTGSNAELRAIALDKITFQPGQEGNAAGIQRVEVTYQNGPNVETQGFDYHLGIDYPTDWGIFTLGTQGTLINKYDVDAWVFAGAFDASGQLNRFNPSVRPLPELKNNVFANWSHRGHNLRLEHWFTSEYEDNATDVPAGQNWDIDSHGTFDLHYNFRFYQEQARVFVSVINLTDEEPPFARLDLAYDPYTHNPFGRMIKAGIQYTFDPFL